MIILREKIFFDYGITSKEISSYAKTNNLGVKEAYSALKTQKANAGVGVEAFKANDASRISGSRLKAGEKGILGKSSGSYGIDLTKKAKVSAAQGSAANTTFNKGYNAGMSAGTKTGLQKGANSVGIMGGLKNTWAKAGTLGKAGMVASGVAAGALLAKGVGSVLSKKKEE